MVNGILSGLRFLTRHARDRAAAGGNALVRSQLYPVSRQQPLELGQYRPGFTDSLRVRIMTDAAPPPERVAPVEALASDGPDLVSAAYLLATDILQEFGVAEAAQLIRDGAVRLPYWNPEWQQTHAGMDLPSGALTPLVRACTIWYRSRSVLGAARYMLFAAASGDGHPGTVYRFRTHRRCCSLRFGRMNWLRQDRGLCPFACST